MVRIRLHSGKKAALADGTRTSDDDSLAAFPAVMMLDYSPADGDPELACSTRIAQWLRAEIIAHEPVPHEYVPGRVY